MLDAVGQYNLFVCGPGVAESAQEGCSSCRRDAVSKVLRYARGLRECVVGCCPFIGLRQ